MFHPRLVVRSLAALLIPAIAASQLAAVPAASAAAAGSPVNTALPVVSGSAIVASTLTTTKGTWTNSPISYTYAWQRCDQNVQSCSTISGATGTTYKLTTSDQSKRIRSVVSAKNAKGTVAAYSAGTSAVVSGKPVNTALPAISGTVAVGSAITATSGTWSQTPTSYGYVWQRCSSTGASCIAITNATSSAYTPVTADQAKTLRVVVTAKNAAGSTVATSNASATVLPAFRNTAVPTISGTAQVGSTLTASQGMWTKTPSGVSYAWQKCDTAGASCVAITAANKSTFVPTLAEVGATLRVVVTAVNSTDTAEATSAQSAKITGPPAPTNTALPTVTGTAQVAQTLTATQGVWSNSPTSYAYQWQRCSSTGASCVDVTGAFTATYVVVSADTTFTIRVNIKATNSGGTTMASSAVTPVVVPAVSLANTAPPTISGTAQVGANLTASNGTWSAVPESYTYQWQRCTNAGTSCIAISDATAQTYLLSEADRTSTLRVAVTAKLSTVTTTAVSIASSVVTAPPAPMVVSVPALFGSAVLGSTVGVTVGTWNNSPNSYTYQWQKCDGAGVNCSDITDATGDSLLLTSGMQGMTVRARVIAINAGGAASAFSATTVAITIPAPTAVFAPTIAGVPSQGSLLTATNGTWDGEPSGFTYVWQRCNAIGAECLDIPGAGAPQSIDSMHPAS